MAEFVHVPMTICQMGNHSVPESKTVIYSDPPRIPELIKACYSCLYKHAQEFYPGGAIIQHINDLRKANGED